MQEIAWSGERQLVFQKVSQLVGQLRAQAFLLKRLRSPYDLHEGTEGEQIYSTTLSLTSALGVGWGWIFTSRSGRFTPVNDPVPIVQEFGWAPGPVWIGAEYIAPTAIRSPASPALSELIYRLSYRGPPCILSVFKNLLATGRFRITITLSFNEIRLTKTRHVESTRFKGSFITLSYNARLLRNLSSRPWI